MLLLEKDRVNVDEGLFAATENGIETPVVLGQVLGHAADALES